jgi:hypothetical protein
MKYSFTYVLGVCSKSMIDARRHNHQVMFLQPDPHPIIILTPNIKITSTIQNIPNLFIFMQMLVEEVLHFLLVDLTHGGRRNGNLITVFVGPLRSQSVYIIDAGVVEVQYAQLGEVFWGAFAAGVMGLALVTLH